MSSATNYHDQNTGKEWTWGARKRKKSVGDDEVALKYTKLDINPVTNQKIPLFIHCDLTPYCSLLPPFTSIGNYENHFKQSHELKCCECNRILRSSRLLHLHLLEIHDTFFRARVNRAKNGSCDKIFECFVDGCDLKFLDFESRNIHLIQTHKYPSKFDFLSCLIGEANKKSASKKSKRKNANDREKIYNMKDILVDTDPTENNSNTVTADLLSEQLKSLNLKNGSVRFGMGITRKKPVSFLKLKSQHDANTL